MPCFPAGIPKGRGWKEGRVLVSAQAWPEERRWPHQWPGKCVLAPAPTPGSGLPAALLVALFGHLLLLFNRSVVSDSLQPPWTVAHQAPPSMGFPRQESWSGVPSPSPPITLSKSSSFYMHLGSHPLKYCPTSVVPTFYIISSSLTGSGPPLNKHALLLPEFIENKTKSTY